MGRGQTTHKQTDIANTRPNRPSGPIRWKLSRMCAARCDRGSLGDSSVSCKSNSVNFPFFKVKIGPTQPESNLNPELTFFGPGQKKVWSHLHSRFRNGDFKTNLHRSNQCMYYHSVPAVRPILTIYPSTRGLQSIRKWVFRDGTDRLNRPKGRFSEREKTCWGFNRIKLQI